MTARDIRYGRRGGRWAPATAAKRPSRQCPGCGGLLWCGQHMGHYVCMRWILFLAGAPQPATSIDVEQLFTAARKPLNDIDRQALQMAQAGTEWAS